MLNFIVLKCSGIIGLTEDHLNLKAITEGIENSVNEILNAPQKSD